MSTVSLRNSLTPRFVHLRDLAHPILSFFWWGSLQDQEPTNVLCPAVSWESSSSGSFSMNQPSNGDDLFATPTAPLCDGLFDV